MGAAENGTASCLLLFCFQGIPKMDVKDGVLFSEKEEKQNTMKGVSHAWAQPFEGKTGRDTTLTRYIRTRTTQGGTKPMKGNSRPCRGSVLRHGNLSSTLVVAFNDSFKLAFFFGKLL